ncbi:MAG: DUF2157 domain-containing protein [Acidimicrobiia bacterium]
MKRWHVPAHHGRALIVTDELERWVGAGLLDEETADRIRHYEATRQQAPASGPSDIGRGVEAAAYAGAALVLVAAVIFTVEFWDRINSWAQFGMIAAAALVLLGVGIVFGRSELPSLQRAQMFAWLLTVVAVFFAAMDGLRDIADIDGQAAFLWSSFAAFGVAAALWGLRRSSLQMVAMGVATAVATMAVIAQIPDEPEWFYGVALFVLGLLWFVLGLGGRFTPRRTSLVLGGLGMVLIAFPEADQLPWPLLGLGVSIGLMVLSAFADEGILLGVGVAGLFVYVPIAAVEVFGDGVGVPLAILMTGLVLLGTVVVVVRRQRAQEP